MKEEKKYYKLLDIIRVTSCIGVLLYHLGYLKGGFLSVCAFFVLSGYLSYTSLSRKEKVSFKDYYKNRFLHIYLPLLAVVLLTTCCVSFIPNIHWFQLKPETTSVLFCYNNYWQLSVNADYFARHVSSPFMHFWYIGILLQFEIIFPFLFILLRFLKEKIGKILPIFLLVIGIVASTYYFITCGNNIMVSYYDTLARVYSLLLGVLLGYIHKEYKVLVFEKGSTIIFYLYLAVFIVLQLILESNSYWYAIVMILVSLITCRLIDYATIDDSKELNFWERETQYLSSVSYEVYLFQYPVIFFFQYITISMAWKLPVMVLLIFGLSYFLHFSFDFKDQKHYYERIVCGILVAIFCGFGLVQYAHAKDYTQEMNDLKESLSANERMIADKQKEYEDRLKQENDEWNSILNDLDQGEENLKSYVVNLPVVAVGDSVMLGAVPTLYQQFPNGYFDAAVNRTDYEANRILQSAKNQGLLSDTILIHLGTNGQCGLPCQREIMTTCEGKHVFIVTVSNDYEVHVNQSFYALKDMYPNISIIDWNSASNGHSEYFAVDGIHLTGIGMNAYKDTIYNGIYQYYLSEYQKKRDAVLKEHEEKMNAKINFYGNDVLLNLYSRLQTEYPDSRFVTKDHLEEEIKKEIDQKTISKKVVIVLDTKEEVKKEEYQKLISLLKEQDVYFLFVYHEPFSFKEDNVHTLNFYQQVRDDYYMVDGIHLSEKGNQELIKYLNSQLK